MAHNVDFSRQVINAQDKDGRTGGQGVDQDQAQVDGVGGAHRERREQHVGGGQEGQHGEHHARPQQEQEQEAAKQQDRGRSLIKLSIPGQGGGEKADGGECPRRKVIGRRRLSGRGDEQKSLIQPKIVQFLRGVVRGSGVNDRNVMKDKNVQKEKTKNWMTSQPAR